MGAILSMINTSLGFTYFALFTLKLLGLSLTTILLIHYLDNNNPLIQNLCSTNKKTNCNAILRSDAARITSWLSWSEVGFFYYAGSFLNLLVLTNSLAPILILNIIALPFTIYSIVYQLRQKKWCLLCCGVLSILWLEFASVYFGKTKESFFNFNLSFSSYVYLSIGFLTPILIWYSLKPIFKKAVQFKPLKQQLKKFKYNSALFNIALTNGIRYELPDNLMPLQLGNPDADTTITIVSSPSCGPCAAAHKLLEEWLSVRDDLQIKVILTTTNDDNNEYTKFSKHITALSLVENRKYIEIALSDWYYKCDRKYELWGPKYPVSITTKVKNVTEKRNSWCELTETYFTPTIFVNGYKLMDPYRLEDIKYLLN